MKIAAILGSTRRGRFGEKPARWIFGELQQRSGVDAEFLDLRDYPMPLFDEPIPPSASTEPFRNEAVARWTARIGAQDGYVVVAPEYNRSVGGAMKNAFDWVYKEWNRKPIAFIGYGGAGGARAIEHMRLISIELQMAPIRAAVHLPLDLFLALRKQEGPVDPVRFQPVQAAADAMLDQLLWWSGVLADARRRDRQAAAA